jgi:beta-lactamase class A
VSASASIGQLAALERRLEELVAGGKGEVGFSVVHIESGRSVAVGGHKPLPLQSVFKLPLAVAVLLKVQAGELGLDQRVTVRAEDRAPGVAMNEQKWKHVPRDVSVRELLEYSLVDSDNTSSDKLLELVGGPAALTERMRALGFGGIVVRSPTKAAGASGKLPNEAPANAIVALLASLQQEKVLDVPQRDLLWEMLRRSRTGERRIRAGLPAGTPVLDKTGTGPNGSVTNDVGVVTLPNNSGHLAIGVLVSGSQLTPRDQEDLVAQLARAAFTAFAAH